MLIFIVLCSEPLELILEPEFTEMRILLVKAYFIIAFLHSRVKSMVELNLFQNVRVQIFALMMSVLRPKRRPHRIGSTLV